jgi:hypothetical protein
MKEISRQAKSTLFESVSLMYLIVLMGAGVLYIVTCAPTILWQDSGMFVYRIWHNDIEGNLGLALSLPLYIMIGIAVKYIPLGELAYRVNLISAVFGAVAVANLFLLVRLWLGKSAPAVVAAITLGLSWTFWFYAEVAKVYTLFAAQMFAELVVLLQYMRTKRIGYLYLLGLLNGLTIASHLWGVFGFACYTIFVIVLLARRQIQLKHFGIIVLMWVIGAAPYEYLIMKNLVVTGDVGGTLASVLFGSDWRHEVLNTSISARIILENIIFILTTFPTPNIVFFFAGLWVLWKVAPNRSFANIIIAMLILHFMFAFRYGVLDRWAFFLPFYCLAAVLIGLGAHMFFNHSNRRTAVVAVLLFALLPIPVYALAPTVAKKAYKALGQRRQVPYRDEYTYWFQPWKTGYRGAERFANEALDTVEENAVIYAYTDVYPLLYVQEVKGKRTDVKIISNYNSSKGAPAFNQETIVQLMKDSAVYVSPLVKDYCPEFLSDNYDFVRAGILWRVVERKQITLDWRLQNGKQLCPTYKSAGE